MGARVLVVDDDPWILRMVTATLEKRSYVVDTAREGREALQVAQSNPPDVIISDVMMPEMDGWTFVQQLRAIPELAAIPVIFLTALAKDESRLRSLGLGPEDYLAKPFRFDDLERRVSGALSRRQMAHPPMPQHPQHPGTQPSGPGMAPVMPPSYDTGITPAPGYAPPGYTPSPYAPHPYGGYPPPAYPYPAQGPPPVSSTPGQGSGLEGPSPESRPPHSNVGTAPGDHRPAPPPGTPQPIAPDSQPPVAARPTPGESPSGVYPASPSGTFPAQRRSTALNGRLEQLGLSSLLVMMEMERKDGLLTLKDTNDGGIGRIFIRGGQVVCARLDGNSGLAGRECVYEMLCWRAGTFSFNAMEVDMEDTVQSSTTHLLMEGARLIDESNRPDGGG